MQIYNFNWGERFKASDMIFICSISYECFHSNSGKEFQREPATSGDKVIQVTKLCGCCIIPI